MLKLHIIVTIGACRRHRTITALLGTTLAVFTTVVGASTAQAEDVGHDLPEAGVFLEGIGLDQSAQTIYVSATNRDGTIYRGRVGDERLEVWQGPQAGNNGRGIDVDAKGQVYVAGGPSAEVRVFSREGKLLAELPTGEAGSFVNDLRVGPDGAVYVTDSALPRIWRVSADAGGKCDGLMLHGHDLFVVQNFSRSITKLRLADDAGSARTEKSVPTPANRTFTTAKEVGGDLLVVDSKFGFPPDKATATDRVVTVKRF